MRISAISALLCVMLSTAAFAVPEIIPNRFGKLEFVGDYGESQLLYNGKPFKPPVLGNNFLSFEKKIALTDRDLVVVQDNGGTACPALLYIVDISKAGAKATRAFGSCTDLKRITSIANGVRITMNGFVGPTASPREVRKAVRKAYAYEYKSGTLTENGKLIK